MHPFNHTSHIYWTKQQQQHQTTELSLPLLKLDKTIRWSNDVRTKARSEIEPVKRREYTTVGLFTYHHLQSQGLVLL